MAEGFEGDVGGTYDIACQWKGKHDVDAKER